MASTVKKLQDKNLLPSPPNWLPSNTHYECMTGSIAYGCGSEDSDIDIVGWAMPPKHIIFPHLNGHIDGFGPKPESFEQYSCQHITDQSSGKEYDVAIYNIVKFFHLAAENNPNMIELLWIPNDCILHMSPIARIVRDNRKLFLTKRSFYKFSGYAASQASKIKNGANKSGKRAKIIEEHGFDTKFAYHLIRLLSQARMILEEEDLNLRRMSEVYKAIRRGEWSKEKIFEVFDREEKSLKEVYDKSTLRHSPDWDALRELLLNCIEDHYGSLSGVITNPNQDTVLINEIEQIIKRRNK